MEETIRNIYTSLENDEPAPKIEDYDENRDRVEKLVATNPTTENIIACRHVKDEIYNCIRVMREEQTRRERVQDMLKNPVKNRNRSKLPDADFKHCSYQLKTSEIPHLIGLDSGSGVRALLIKNTHWNRNCTRKHTAKSERRLVEAWREHVRSTNNQQFDQ